MYFVYKDIENGKNYQLNLWRKAKVWGKVLLQWLWSCSPWYAMSSSFDISTVNIYVENAMSPSSTIYQHTYDVVDYQVIIRIFCINFMHVQKGFASKGDHTSILCMHFFFFSITLEAKWNLVLTNFARDDEVILAMCFSHNVSNEEHIAID